MRKEPDDWPLASALLVTAGFTLGVIFLAHFAAHFADLIKQ